MKEPPFMQSSRTVCMLTRCLAGQALVEFILVTPLLLIIMVAGALVGLAMYQGNLSSEAIKEPALHKQEMAATVGSVSNGTLLGYTSQGAKGLLPSSGAPLDSLRQVNINDRVTVLVGTKNYRPPMGGLLPNLSFDFSVSNAIQRKLLEPMNQGGAAGGGGPVQRSANDIPARTPPWQLPGKLPSFGGCATGGSMTVSPAGARIISSASKTYLSAVSWSKSVPLDMSVVYDLAKQHMAECDGEGAGMCELEYKAYQPEPDAMYNRKCTYSECKTVYHNPPGAPGMTVTVTVEFVGTTLEEVETTNPDGTVTTEKVPTAPPEVKNPQTTFVRRIGLNAADAGMYYDPTGQYIKPPTDFVDSCKKIKQGECALSKAADRAVELGSQLQAECQL